MAHDVFISYANGDRARAAELASALETNGWSVWWDRDIPPGRAFDEVIEEALTQTRSVVVLWSAESVKSRWVRSEASAAAERDTLVPALIEPATIPLEFRRIEAADLTNWHGEQAHHELQALLTTLSGLIKTDTRIGSAPRTLPAGARGSAAGRPAHGVGNGLSILAAFIAGGGVVYFLTAADGGSGASSPEETSASAAEVRTAPSADTGTEGTGAAVYPTPWQEFKFKPVRARFFKLHVISAWDATANPMPTVTEWQLLGSF